MGDRLGPQRVHPHRPRDILDLLLADVIEGVRESVADMVADGARDADPARRRERLHPGSDIYAVAEDVVLFYDHVAEIDADAEPDPALFGYVRLTVDHPALHLDRAPHDIHHARELGKKAVTGVLYDAATMLLDLRLDQLAEMGLEALVRSLLIGGHKREEPGASE